MPEPCFECGSTEMIGTACKACNPEITDPSFGMFEDDEPCHICGAVPGTEEYGTVGDGFDGMCPSCADAAEPEEDD